MTERMVPFMTGCLRLLKGLPWAWVLLAALPVSAAEVSSSDFAALQAHARKHGMVQVTVTLERAAPKVREEDRTMARMELEKKGLEPVCRTR